QIDGVGIVGVVVPLPREGGLELLDVGVHVPAPVGELELVVEPSRIAALAGAAAQALVEDQAASTARAGRRRARQAVLSSADANRRLVRAKSVRVGSAVAVVRMDLRDERRPQE